MTSLVVKFLGANQDHPVVLLAGLTRGGTWNSTRFVGDRIGDQHCWGWAIDGPFMPERSVAKP